MYPQHQLLMHQVQQQPYLQPQMNMQTVLTQPKQTHWFDQMCEAITSQQSRHEAGSLDIPPMLTPGNYVQWSSRFLRFLELKKPHGKYMRRVLFDGPFQLPTRTIQGDPNATPPRPDTVISVSESQLTEEERLHYEANALAMSYIC